MIDAHLGDGVAIADLRLAERYSDEPGLWQAHPALVDVAGPTVGVALAPPHDENVIYVPIGYERVWMRNPLPASIRVRARRSAATSPDLLRVDLLGLDAAGEAVMDIVGLDLLPVTQHGHLAEVEDDAAVATISGHAAPLIELADELGIRAHEGVEMVERLLAGQYPRLIGSTIDVDDLRRQLDREAVDEPTTTAAHTSTTSGVATAEDAIRMMWVELLGVDEIADDDDFFELGGHSLVAIRLMSRIHKELSVRLQLATIFEASTVGGLATKVRENRPDLDEFLAGQSGRGRDAQSTATSSAPASTAPTEMTQHLGPDHQRRARVGRSTSSTGRVAMCCSCGASPGRWRVNDRSSASRPTGSTVTTSPTPRSRRWLRGTSPSFGRTPPARTCSAGSRVAGSSRSR